MRDISTDWTIVSFAGNAAPRAPVAMPRLASWSAASDESLKYFSGRAVYERTVSGVKGARVFLDLGDVREIANVFVNGSFVKCLWDKPYRVELPAACRKGDAFTLRVEVINTWPNRLIGDAVLRARGVSDGPMDHGWPKWVLDGKTESGTGLTTWSNFSTAWQADDRLRPAGLLGPVVLQVAPKGAPVEARFASGCPEYAPELKDRCWMWGHTTGQYDHPNGWFRIPVSPNVTLAESCRYMGIPNVCIVIWHLPDEAFMADFKDLKRVAWVVDNGDIHLHGKDILPSFLKFGEDHLKTMPNLMGFEFDDFFDQPRKPLRKEKLADGTEVDVLPGSRTLEELRSLRTRLHSYDRPVDMRLVFYERDLDHPEATKPVVDLFDTVMFWTWYGKNVQTLEKNFRAYRKIAPKKPTLLGVYMWDFGGAQPLGDDAMKMQLDFALRLFRAGEVEGFVFHCTPLVNKNLSEVEMVRRWIIAHGNEKYGQGEQTVAPTAEPPELRPDQKFVSYGTVAFKAGQAPDSALLLTAPGRIRIVERSGRIAWENVACRNPKNAFYKDAAVYYDEDGVQKRIPYSLPCNRTLAPETVPAAKRAVPPQKQKTDPSLLDCLADRADYTSAVKLQR